MTFQYGIAAIIVVLLVIVFLWKGIKKSRAIKGKGKSVSASEFLEKDRRAH